MAFDYREILNPELLKESIISYLKSNYQEYDNMDFAKQDSSKMVIDVQTYLTQLVSNRFEQQVSDFYISTSTTDKIDLLLSQWGYFRSFGTPSQVLLELSFDSNSMMEMNELGIKSLNIPPLIIKIKDDNNNIWMNKNSLLITKTPSIIKKENGTTYYKYQITSFYSGQKIPFIQQDFKLKKLNSRQLPYEQITFLNEQVGYPIHRYYLNDYTKINLDISIFDQIEEFDVTLRNKTKRIFEKSKDILEVTQSKYHVKNYDTYINNKYIKLYYDDINKRFDLITGNGKDNGQTIIGNKYLQYYVTRGSKGGQVFGQINKFFGLSKQVMVNDRIYTIQEFQDLNMFDIRYLLNPQKIVLDFDYRTKNSRPQEEVFIWDFLDTNTNNQKIEKYNFSKWKILVKQSNQVVEGQNQETLEEVKFNFSRYIKSKDKIVTIEDINTYLDYFLKGKTYSLNQVTTYKNQISKSYVDKIENTLFILPQVFKTDYFKDLELPFGYRIQPSEVDNDPNVLYNFIFTGEKQSIINELRKKVIQTMDVQFQKDEIFEVLTKTPFTITQSNTVPIETIIQNIRTQLDSLFDLKSDTLDIFNNLNLMDIITQINNSYGVSDLNQQEFLEKLKIIQTKRMYSNFTMPLQKLISSRFNDKIKTIYLVPLSTHLDTDVLISNTLTLDMFNNITGEILESNFSEKYENQKENKIDIINYLTQYPIQIDKLRINKLDSYFDTNVYQDHDFELPFIVDGINSKITKISTDKTNYDQLVLQRFRQVNKQSGNLYEERITSQQYVQQQESDIDKYFGEYDLFPIEIETEINSFLE